MTGGVGGWVGKMEPGRRHGPFMMWRRLEWGRGEAASWRLWLGPGWQGVTQTRWQEAFLSAQSQQTLMLVCQSTSFFRCETAGVTTRERCCFVGGMPVTKTMIRTSTIAFKKKKKNLDGSVTCSCFCLNIEAQYYGWNKWHVCFYFSCSYRTIFRPFCSFEPFSKFVVRIFFVTICTLIKSNQIEFIETFKQKTTNRQKKPQSFSDSVYICKIVE